MRATELAQSFFEPLIAKASTSSERASLLHQRGVLYLCSSCKARALKDLNDAIHLLPKNSDERSDLLYHRARALLLPPSPEPVAAIADLSQCIAAHPDDADPLLVRASAYKLIGRKDLAQADIDRADKLSTKPAAATVAEPRPSGKP